MNQNILNSKFNFSRRIFPLLLPQWCHLCEKEIRGQDTQVGLCQECRENLPLFPEAQCSFCGGLKHNCPTRNLNHLSQFESLFLYCPPVSNWLIGFKYHQNISQGKILANILARWVEERQEIYDAFDLVIPVPSDFRVFFKRGLNPAYILGKTAFKKRLKPGLCKKIKSIPHQISLSHTQRLALGNKAPYQITDSLEGMSVLIFDDVCTSRATMQCMAAIIKKAGAKNIAGLSLLRSL